MKERPMLFNGPMVRAILSGQKTVTRRVAKPVKHPDLGNIYAPGALVLEKEPQHVIERACPYGQPGDRLWVRETWQDVHPVQVIDRYSQPGRAGITCQPGVNYQTIYRADGDYPVVYHTHQHPYRSLEPDPAHGLLAPAESGWTGWTPSIHMPRWASRILLEITSVRVERLQGISDQQAIAEGIERSTISPRLWKRGNLHGDQNTVQVTGFPTLAFRSIWEGVYGYESWAANPWVWVIEFKQVPV